MNGKDERLETPTYLSLGQAATLSGKAKGTISKALKSGKLSYIEKTSAGYKIDPAELFRVFPKPPETPQYERLETPQETRENSVLQAKLDAQQKLMERMESEIGDLKGQRDKWQEQAMTLLLTNQQQPTGAENSPRGGFFGIFRGKGN